MKTVHCVVLQAESAALPAPPHPGELGIRIYEHVSEEGWRQWLRHLTMVINENGLNTAEPAVMGFIEEHMKGFFFHEGPYAGAGRFRPPNPVEKAPTDTA